MAVASDQKSETTQTSQEGMWMKPFANCGSSLKLSPHISRVCEFVREPNMQSSTKVDFDASPGSVVATLEKRN